MKRLRWPLFILLPLVPIALAFAFRYLAIDACLDIGGDVVSTFRTCVLKEQGILVSSSKLVGPTLKTLMFIAGLGAIVGWVALFTQYKRLARAMLGLQISTVVVVGATAYLGDVHHASWQPLSIYVGWLAGLLASIASIVVVASERGLRWLWTIPAALVLGVLGFVMLIACCLSMGS